MFDKVMALLKASDDLLRSSRHDALEMIRTTREMFLIACEALHGEITESVWNRIAVMDQEVNRQQMAVRKDVFSHLALARNRDLLTGLQLLSVVVDVERVGDYTKNIAELAKITPAQLDFDDHNDGVKKLERDVLELFELTHTAFAEEDERVSQQVMARYREVSAYCDETLMEILAEEPDDGVDRSTLVLVLLLRYIKRVGAHLKNAASVMVNPYHRIGYEAMMRGGTIRD